MNESAFKPKRRAGNASLKVLKLRASKREEEVPETVQGISTDSVEEGRAAAALGYLGIPFRFHEEFQGGSDRRGGLVIDILALTRPKPTPIFIQSTYWHGPERRKRGIDEWNLARVWQKTRQMWNFPIEVWDYQLTSIEQAIDTFYKLLGRGY